MLGANGSKCVVMNGCSRIGGRWKVEGADVKPCEMRPSGER